MFSVPLRSAVGLGRLAASLLLLAAPALAQAPTLTSSQPIYAVGEQIQLTLKATPGHQVWVLADFHPGTTALPGIGSFDLAMSNDLVVAYGGVVPASGTMDMFCDATCDKLWMTNPSFFQVAVLDPAQPLPVAVSNRATVEVVRGPECGDCPQTPVADPQYGLYPGGTAIFLHGIGDDFVFDTGASFAEYKDGTATLNGVIYRTSAPTERFQVDMLFNQRIGPADGNYPPPGSPKKELAAGAYFDQGGPVDTDTWHYYQAFTGLLLGMDDYAGGAISVQRMGPAFQVGYGADGKDVDFGGSGWFKVRVVQQPTQTTWAAVGTGDANFRIGQCPPAEDPLCVIAAAPDQYSPQQQLAPHAVVMFGYDGKYLFQAPGALWTEYPDGTATMKGTLVHESDATKTWDLDLKFIQKIDVGAVGNPPPGSPKLELLPGAYVWNNGPVDPATWWYYEEFSGTMKGGGYYAGADVLVTRRGPAFQVGLGASGKNINLGGAAWTWFDVVTQPATAPALPLHTEGDINVEFIPCPPTGEPRCVTAAAVDLLSPQQGLAPHAVVMFGYDGKYLFQGQGAEWIEYANGTATMKGQLVHESDPTKTWDWDVTFTGLIPVGAVGNPPPGSPKLELLPSAYVWNNGPIDPATWYYYDDLTGTMTGGGFYAGAKVQVTRRGPAFQVGVGASGKNGNFGGSCWTWFDVITQPTTAAPLALHTEGDVNVDILPCKKP